ncbi:chorismate mutase [Ferrimonas marina]|uniref:3-deoxy-D-arabinoheptulosonate-7-phosphate synthase /chorismate mutase n=1 Tax=Ferrimonas marina TaxID=299255 RepID=A0A1M5ZTB6_9GAMM|nr:chorismate mutase [Ferrimonas marina]SHI27535.1 3-deoxy-D-arabinoheptulosonate-7-phosphate synthase /chorismate mutase [Ferrimonas marina]
MSQQHPVEPIRRQITELDQQLLSLLAKRRALSLEVAKSKRDVVKPVRDSQRESALLTRLVQQGRELGLDGQYVSRLFHTIIEDSVLRQQAWFQAQNNPDAPPSTRVAFLGAKGSYSYLAAQSYFERRDQPLEELGQDSFDAIFAAVEQGQADYGVLPVENTSSGSINEVFDLLQHTALHIVGETTESIPHCVLMADGGDPGQIKTVFAHPQVHTQCSRYLATLDVEQAYVASSAEAMALAQTTPNSVALGSERGGALYGLNVIQREIANQPRNETRFLLVARKPVEVPPQVPAKTTLLMATGQQPGALVEALGVLRDLGINMTKLESRPIHGNPWEEMFYLDVSANLRSEAMQTALRELTRLTRFIKVLGCYPCETVLPTELDSQALADDPRVPAQPIQAEQPLFSREHKAQTQAIRLGHQHLGDGSFLTLAGPGLANEPLAQWGRRVKEHGGAVLWGGEQAQSLTELRQVGQQVGLPVMASWSGLTPLSQLTADCDLVLAADAVVHHPDRLQQLGQSQRPVVLQRAAGTSGEALLAAAEQILSQGNQQVILCETGHCGSDGIPRLDLAMVAWLKQRTHLPVLVAPAMASAPLLASLVAAARGAEADGVLLPLGSEGLDSDGFAQLMKGLYC